MNQLALKVYDINYEFILKNYLDPKMWDTIWPVFEYRGTVISMHISSIYVQCRNVYLQFNIKDDQYEASSSISINLNNFNMKVIKKQICGACRDCVTQLEQKYIENSPEYRELSEQLDDLETEYEDAAIEHLDSLGIDDDDIRNPYIDNQKSKVNAWSKKYDFKQDMIYNYLSDLWLVLTETFEDKSLYKSICKQLGVSPKGDVKVIEVI